ncbi:hypothetical protein PVAND_016422 [Polypedilum vanderplanki]|uniref:glutathione transferase n=1 Tax=Polypedilum vanderplanki TaxID=319348 RepID=A0A9J6BG63_POLVA|nr:hypothetical protein PVAND_016422 [Polypedilum vanderplanki]
MPTYKVSYFTFSGLGEPVRYTAAYCNVDFIDNRVTWEEWSKLKSTTPLGQMPILEIDGKVYHQSIPICRYLGNKFNLTGDNAEEIYEVDVAAETVNELRGKVGMWAYSCKREKNEKYEELIKKTIPSYLSKLDEQAGKNGGFLAIKDKITWADCFATGVLEYINSLVDLDVLVDYKNLQKVRENVVSSEGVKKYLKNRPAEGENPFKTW